MTIAVDFDGTVVKFAFPRIGEDIGAVPVLKKIIEKGHKLILLTMRSDKTLEEAVEWFRNNEIPLYGVNRNPSQWTWTKSKKVHADVYIDDQALEAPLIMENGRGYIDWNIVEETLGKKGII